MTSIQAHDDPTAPAGAQREPLLVVKDLSVTFARRGQQPTRAVSEVSFSVRPGEHVGLVGESGSGKSVTSLAILGLLPSTGVEVGGLVEYAGQDLLTMPTKQRSSLRGREIAMVFQDPMSSLNPVVRVGTQIAEVLERHKGLKRNEATDRAVELLDMVGIPDPRRRVREYPHQLSGGMRQRVLIAIALACEPRLLIADEPTTALDVTIQAQILELLKSLVADTNTALIMITHDLGVVAGLCETVHVMYAGKIVEAAGRHELFARPRHPYTAGLLGSVPRLDQPRGSRLNPIKGSPSDTIPWPKGCAFAPRCPNVVDICTSLPPGLEPHGDRLLRCYNPLTPDQQAAVR